MIRRAIIAVCGTVVIAGGAQSAPLETRQPTNRHLVLGVLEDDMQDFGRPHFRAVRVVFQKNGNGWQAFPSDCENQKCLSERPALYPSKLTWTVVLGGKRLGTVMGQTQTKFDYYSGVGLQKIVSLGPVPSVGEPSLEFAGWVGEPNYRPLVANSQPYYRDPDLWKLSQLSTADVKLMRREFRRRFPRVSNCKNPDENVARLWAYPDSDIGIEKSYISKAGWKVVRVALGDYGCDGPLDGAFAAKVFAISPAQEIRFLDEGMHLVDAGDYDNDGKSELLFSIDRYDAGGYELFYDDFRRRAVFNFHYH